MRAFEDRALSITILQFVSTRYHAVHRLPSRHQTSWLVVKSSQLTCLACKACRNQCMCQLSKWSSWCLPTRIRLKRTSSQLLWIWLSACPQVHRTFPDIAFVFPNRKDALAALPRPFGNQPAASLPWVASQRGQLPRYSFSEVRPSPQFFEHQAHHTTWWAVCWSHCS